MRNTIGGIALGIAASVVVAACLDGRRRLFAGDAYGRRARSARRGARARRRVARGLERDQEAAAQLRLLHRQAALVGRGGPLLGRRHDRGRRPRRLRRAGADPRVLAVARPRDAAAEALVRSHAAAADRARGGRRPDGARPLARVRAGGRARRVRELGLGRARERLREGRRHLEDSPPSLLHDDVHAVRSGVGQDGDSERGAVGRSAAGSAAERRLRGVSRRRSSCRFTTTTPSRGPRRACARAPSSRPLPPTPSRSKRRSRRSTAASACSRTSRSSSA